MGKAKRSGGYYAVQKGRQPGIFRSWSECEAATKGFAGAVFKKFDSEAAAREFVKGDGYGAASSAASTKDGASMTAGSSRSYHPYPHAEARSNKGHKTAPTKASTSASVLGKRPSDHLPQPSSKKPSNNAVFPAPSTSGGSQRKSVVYCDGSSIGNGKSHARAGWGVFFEDPDLHHLNESRRLPGPIQTNNRAELMAIIRAIQLCPNDGRQLVVMSDSQYSMNTVDKWLPGWRRNGFKTSTGGDVQNRDLIVQLDHELSSRYPHPKLEYVKGHAGIDGNEIVDGMAKYGASLPESDSSDLSRRSQPEESHVARPEVTVGGYTINVSVSPTKQQADMGW